MNIGQKIVILSLSCVLLSACQNTKPIKEPKSYSLAVNSGGGVQRTKNVPVPMPGQLMPLKKTKTKKLSGKDAIDAANKKAVEQPTSGKYVNSIMTFDYMPGALYQIYAAPLKVTDIQFQNNETIVAVGAGDTLRWQVSKTYSGVGANKQEHLLVKPTDSDLENSLVVTTNMRTYHLVLHSTSETYMASVTWRYPDSDDIVTSFEDGNPNSIASITNGIDVNSLNFSYQAKLVKGKAPDWYPKMIFNDGRKTYIKFPDYAQDAPTLFVGEKKNSQIVNYRVQGNYYIVDSVIRNAQLRGGINNDTYVQISMMNK